MGRSFFRTLAVLSMAIFVALGSGCASHTRTRVVVVEAPPAPRAEKRPHPPGKHYVWAQGHWAYAGSRGDYVWMSGRWIKAKKNHTWVDGHWKHRGNDWVWVAGYWQPPGKAKGKSKGTSSDYVSTKGSKSHGHEKGKGSSNDKDEDKDKGHSGDQGEDGDGD